MSHPKTVAKSGEGGRAVWAEEKGNQHGRNKRRRRSSCIVRKWAENFEDVNHT